MSRLPALLALLTTCVSAFPVPVEASSPSDLSFCEEELARNPDREEPARCFYELATGTAPARAAAARRLQELVDEHPDRPWFPIYLGKAKGQSRDPEELKRAEALYSLGAELALRRGMAEAELSARWGLCRILRNAGRLDEEEAEVERAARAARASGLPVPRLRSEILRAMHWYARGEFEQSYVCLRRIQSDVEAQGSYELLRDHLFTLAKAAQETGRLQETLQIFRQAAAQTAGHGDLPWLAQARYGMAGVLLYEALEVPSEAARRQLLESAQGALAAARASGRTSMETQPLWLLGLVEGTQKAREDLERCFEVAATAAERSYCRSALARRLAVADPEGAKRAIDEAMTLAKESGSVQAQTSSWSQHMRVSWALKPGRALADARAALDAIEALRDQQEGGSGQPGLFSTWAEHYYWLSGQFLREGQLEPAFGVIERMRSRTLIDALGLSPTGIPPGLQARRAALLLDVARVQRLLLDASREEEHARARAELNRLELEVSALQSRIAKADPDFGAIRFASLGQVRATLAPDEALLSFQVAPWKDLTGDFGGGSWLLVSTRADTRVHRLPDRIWVRSAVTSFTGMFPARDGSEEQAASRLYRELLRPALAGLPAEVRRLVIVADDSLHRLPFAALRPEPDGEPLATRYEITLAPSATLWLHWRETRPAPAVTPALVLADPVTLLRLEPLPYSRAEGKSVVRHLGGGELLAGKKASETYIKRDGAEPFGLVHFAAHAVTDEVDPDRSGVYLSPGDPKEDGLLQAREIVDLDHLEGRIVVLSTCESASGEILRGEGVMGLARAFFQARAHTVVASLWPLLDDEGAALFDRFYLHLGQGRSMAAALQAAQRDRMKAGAPAIAWAGVVVLGDGDRVPVPGGRGPGWAVWLAVLLAVFALVSVMGLLLWRSNAGRRSRRSAS